MWNCNCLLCKRSKYTRNPYRINVDRDIENLRRIWTASGLSSDYHRYRRTAERARLTVGSCAFSNEDSDNCEQCGNLLCDECLISECGVCATLLCQSCVEICSNCNHAICKECMMRCEKCSRFLCQDENCNEDEEFIKKCDVCYGYYCHNDSDDCYAEHSQNC